MENNSLLKRAGALGFPLLGVENSQDANLTLADMAKSRDLRLWEGFPVVLANSAENGLFDYNKASQYLKKPSDRANLASLLVLSLVVYKFFSLKFSWADKFYKLLSEENRNHYFAFLEKLKNDQDFTVTGLKMSGARLKSVFNNYFSQSQAKLNELLLVKDELKLEYALTQVFSPKQKELFLKKLKREKLTKTEKEYFSRVVKKKVLALANPELHRLAQGLLG